MTAYSIPMFLSSERIQAQSLETLGFVQEFSLVTGGELTDGEITFLPRPRELEQSEVDALLTALRALQPIEPYYGEQCENAVDVDRATSAAISQALAPNKPPDLQQLERERLLAESTAAMMVMFPQILQALNIAMPPDVAAMFADNLSKWQTANTISEAGRAFKAEHGWGGEQNAPTK